MQTVFEELRNGIHRTRAIDGDGENDILQTRGAHLHEHFSHTARFELENAVRFARGDQLIGLFIVKGDAAKIKIRLGKADLLFRIGHDGEISQTQKVEFEKSELGDGIHRKLGERHFIVDRDGNVFMDGAVCDDDACGVRGGMTGHTLERFGNINETANGFVIAVHITERALECLFDGDVQVIGNGFCYGIHVGIAHAKHAPDVADDCLCRERSKGGDAADVISAVFFGNVFDDLAAAVIAEVRIKVGHTDALGV